MDIADLLGTAGKPHACEWCHTEHAGVCDEMIAEASRRAIRNPDLVSVQRYNLMALTTEPFRGFTSVVLMWMQLEPGKWHGYYPEYCVHASQMVHETGESV